MIETINRLLQTSRQLLKELGREPYPEEIAERMDIPIAKVRRILRLMKQTLSMRHLSATMRKLARGLHRRRKSPSPSDAAIGTYPIRPTLCLRPTTREEGVDEFGIGEAGLPLKRSARSRRYKGEGETDEARR